MIFICVAYFWAQDQGPSPVLGRPLAFILGLGPDPGPKHVRKYYKTRSRSHPSGCIFGSSGRRLEAPNATQMMTLMRRYGRIVQSGRCPLGGAKCISNDDNCASLRTHCDKCNPNDDAYASLQTHCALRPVPCWRRQMHSK